MILYVNGDSHAAAAEAVNTYAFAEDDKRYFYMGRVPHPDNAWVGWPRRLADTLKARLHCQAESASSNDRILRTTREWMAKSPSLLSETLMVIQWSTWEREEWLHKDVYYQINASGQDQVPAELQEKYRHYVIDVDWMAKTLDAHDKIWTLHQELSNLGIKHVFFNGNSDFSKIPLSQRHDWGTAYINPYQPESTYDAWLKNNGFVTVSPDSYHFGADAHAAWGRFVLQYIVKNNLMV